MAKFAKSALPPPHFSTVLGEEAEKRARFAQGVSDIEERMRLAAGGVVDVEKLSLWDKALKRLARFKRQNK